jgi:hypothetical protein
MRNANELTMPRRTANPRPKLSPLDYLLHVINDRTASDSRRDRAAIAAAQYVHARPQPIAKKAQREAEAATAGQGTEWAGDLDLDWNIRRQ